MLGEAAVAMTYVRRSVGGLLITRWLYGKIVGKRVVSAPRPVGGPIAFHCFLAPAAETDKTLRSL